MRHARPTRLLWPLLGLSFSGLAAASPFILHEERQDTELQYVVELRDFRRPGLASDMRIGAQCPTGLVSYVEGECRPSDTTLGPWVDVKSAGEESLSLAIAVQGTAAGAAAFDRILQVHRPDPTGSITDVLRVSWNLGDAEVLVTLVSGGAISPYLATLDDLDLDVTDIVAGQNDIVSLYNEYGFEDPDKGPFIAVPVLGWVGSLRLVPDSVPEPLTPALVGTALAALALARRSPGRVAPDPA